MTFDLIRIGKLIQKDANLVSTKNAWTDRAATVIKAMYTIVMEK